MRRPDSRAPRVVRAATLFGVALYLSMPLPAFADGFVLDFFSAITAGRAGTNLSFFDNGAILLDNPASLTNISSRARFDVSAGFLLGDLTYSDPQNQAAGGDFGFPENPSAVANVSYIRRSADSKWAVGAGLYVPGGFGTLFELDTTFAGKQLYRSLAAITKMIGGVAFQVTDRLSIGGSFGIAYMRGELDAPYYVQSAPLTGVPTISHWRLNAVAPTWGLGLQYRVGDRTAIGIAYTSEVNFDLSGDAEAEVYFLAPVPLASSFDMVVDFRTPRSLGFGVHHQLSGGGRLSSDVVWYDWSSAMRTSEIVLTNADHPAFAGQTLRDDLPFEWNDSVSLKIGYEDDLSGGQIVRVGYVYHPNPVPEATFTTFIPGIVEHVATVGFGWRGERVSFDLAYALNLGSMNDVQSELAGGDFDASSLSLRYHMMFPSLTLEF